MPITAPTFWRMVKRFYVEAVARIAARALLPDWSDVIY
jgi:hypothetical protein